MSSTSRRTASPSPACLVASWRKEAASRLSRSSPIRTSSGAISGRSSSRSAAWGSVPGGLRTRCRPTGDEGWMGVTNGDLTARRWIRRTSSRSLVRHREDLRPPGAVIPRSLRMTATADVRPDAPRGGSDGADTGLEQPYAYRRQELVEPDWRRLPGFRDVTAEEWASAQWQRAHCVKNVKQLRELMRSEEHTSELQSQSNLVCRLLLEKKKYKETNIRL